MITIELVKEINEYFKKRNHPILSVDAVSIDGVNDTLVSEIYDGDWKHEHLAIEILIRDFFEEHPTLSIVKKWTSDYEGSDGDWYSETHYWQLAEKKNVKPKGTEIPQLTIFNKAIKEGKVNTTMNPKYLTKEQIDLYIKKNTCNEKLMVEGPIASIKGAMNDHKNKKIIDAAQDYNKSGSYTFIIKGKEYSFDALQDAIDSEEVTDRDILGATVVNKQGYYVRKGLQNVEKQHQFRRSSATDKARPEHTPQSQMQGDYRKWVFMTSDGKYRDWSDFSADLEEGNISDEELKKVIVIDTAKKKFPYEEAKGAIAKQQKAKEKKDKKADAKADAKATSKAEKDGVKQATKSTNKKKPQGRIKITHNGKSINTWQFNKLPPKEKKTCEFKDSKGNVFSYEDISKFASVRGLRTSYERTYTGKGLNESIHREGRKIDSTIQGTKAKSDTEYDDDTSSLDYLV
jgi:hypothetical protein